LITAGAPPQTLLNLRGSTFKEKGGKEAKKREKGAGKGRGKEKVNPLPLPQTKILATALRRDDYAPVGRAA